VRCTQRLAEAGAVASVESKRATTTRGARGIREIHDVGVLAEMQIDDHASIAV
jgi:hypothetical protein